MSRIGKKVVQIPKGVQLTISDGELKVKGPKGEIVRNVAPHTTIEVTEENGLPIAQVRRDSDSKFARSCHGLMRALLNNMVIGVSTGFQKVLEINGVGYRAEAKGKVVNFQLGYSHPIAFPVPDGIDISVEKQTTVTIKGIDKQLVGETAARIRALRPPEPYKGKGVKYIDEHIRRKAGKANV